MHKVRDGRVASHDVHPGTYTQCMHVDVWGSDNERKRIKCENGICASSCCIFALGILLGGLVCWLNVLLFLWFNVFFIFLFVIHQLSSSGQVFTHTSQKQYVDHGRLCKKGQQNKQNHCNTSRPPFLSSHDRSIMLLPPPPPLSCCWLWPWLPTRWLHSRHSTRSAGPP